MNIGIEMILQPSFHLLFMNIRVQFLSNFYFLKGIILYFTNSNEMGIKIQMDEE